MRYFILFIYYFFLLQQGFWKRKSWLSIVRPCITAEGECRGLQAGVEYHDESNGSGGQEESQRDKIVSDSGPGITSERERGEGGGHRERE